MLHKRKVSILVIALLYISMNSQGLIAASQSNKVDENIAQSVEILTCATEASLDCVEAIEVTDNSGNTSKGQPSDTSNLGIGLKETFFLGRDWTIEGKSWKFKAGFTLITPPTLRSGGSKSIQNGLTVVINPGPEIPESTIWKIRIRTSWLNPLKVEGRGGDVFFQREIIPGGSVFTFKGNAVEFNDTDTLADGQALLDIALKRTAYKEIQASKVSQQVNFTIQHANPLFSPKDALAPNCAHAGFPVTFSNAKFAEAPRYAEGTLKMANGAVIAEKGELFWLVAAPHFTFNNSILVGTYLSVFPRKWMACAFPGSQFATAPKAIVSIVDSEGVPQVATTLVNSTADEIRVLAENFHFSLPIFRLSVPVDLSTKSIKCIKGKLIKKVVSNNPKCPKGYVQSKVN